MLEECKSASASDASFTWVDEDFLLQEKVVAWSEMPLWMPEAAAPHMKGFMFTKSAKAVAADLNFRPLRDTIKDLLTWRETNCRDEPLQAGIDDLKEKKLLQKWHETR